MRRAGYFWTLRDWGTEAGPDSTAGVSGVSATGAGAELAIGVKTFVSAGLLSPGAAFAAARARWMCRSFAVATFAAAACARGLWVSTLRGFDAGAAAREDVQVVAWGVHTPPLQ